MSDPGSIQILIAEDEMLIAADIARLLGKLGYVVAGIATRGEDVLKVIESTRPDIILMDIALRGTLDGVEAAIQILQQHQIPVIFVTSNIDDVTFQRAKAAKPYAFIGKPFQESDIIRAIEMTLERIGTDTLSRIIADPDVSILNDRLFVRDKEQLVKVAIHDILYLEAERNYCKIHTGGRTFLVSVPMGGIEQHLPLDSFVRTHRSFIVNIRSVSAIDEHHEYLMIEKNSIPISRRLREDVISRFKML